MSKEQAFYKTLKNIFIGVKIEWQDCLSFAYLLM
jgi:hypothetical protein